MSRSMALALTAAVLFAGGAVGCWWRASELRGEGRWLLERGSAQAEEYARSFDGSYADGQLQTFAQRRAVLERSLTWQRLQLVFVLASVVCAFSSYVFFLFRRLRDQLVEGAGDDPALISKI